jgi:hypothetical protein
MWRWSFPLYIAWSRIGNAAVQLHSFFTSGLNGGEILVLDCVWNVMAQAQKPDFVFRLNGRVHLNRWKGGGVSSVDYWQASCAHQPAGFVLLVQACVLQSCDAYWLPTPFSCFLFTSASVRHRVPSHFKRSLQPQHFTPGNCRPIPVGVLSAELKFSTFRNKTVFIANAKTQTKKFEL